MNICPCGKLVKRIFCRGHNRLGTKWNESQRKNVPEKIGKTRKKLFKEGKIIHPLKTEKRKEIINKISISNTGKIVSIETRKKQSLSRTGKKQTQETINKRIQKTVETRKRKNNYKSWSIGLTKETDIRIANISDKVLKKHKQKNFGFKKGEPPHNKSKNKHNYEPLKRSSESQSGQKNHMFGKGYLRLGKSNPNHKLNKFEQLFLKLFSDKTLIHRYKFDNYRGKHYEVDFYEPSSNTCYEIDSNKKDLTNEYQQKRTNFIVSKGYKIIRYTHKQLEELVLQKLKWKMIYNTPLKERGLLK